MTDGALPTAQTSADEITKLQRRVEALEAELAAHKESGAQIARFANQLRTAADVAKQLSSILDLNTLLSEVVTLLRERLQLYHVHVYLLDNADRTLRIVAGSGNVGQTLRESKHSIPLDREHSLVARAAREGYIILTGDVSVEPDFMPNPLLPNTRSEMTIPLILAEQVLGVLDVQDDRAHRFDQMDLAIFSAFSGHIASAIQNAYLYEEVQRHARTLEERNAELEQFAYVASHDLQEPLRIIASYVQLLERRYDEVLDEDGRLFMRYIVEGALRMKALINGLLDYSRLGRSAQPFALTDCETVLTQVITNLQVTIQEKQAVVHREPLPTVMGDALQLSQLWQNLLSNALKFGGERPEIWIGARRGEKEWLFWVRDQGIGLDVQYGERIFAIFQRLHTIEEYPGTGIGLAICKRIVERHNGRLWVESQPGAGATFFFTLPA
jgi:signal transduction histidine kinase